VQQEKTCVHLIHWGKSYKENYTLSKTLQRKQYIGENTTKKIVHWGKYYKENCTLGKTQLDLPIRNTVGFL
jgi:hypothetical protein